MKQTVLRLKLSMAGRRLALIVGLGIVVAVIGLLTPVRFTQSADAATGIYKTINFQGKVVNTNGTNVTDGNYTFRFRIYTGIAGDTGTTCANTCIWEESKSVSTVNSVFQTNLGDTTTLPGAVNFNTDNLYIGVVFNGDSEMTPRIRLSAVPYAFNADLLDGLDSSQLVQLTPAGGQQSGSINVSGGITTGGTVFSNTYDAYTSGSALTLGGTNANGLTLAKNTTLGSGLTLSLQGSNALNLGSTTAAGGIVFKDGTANNRAITISAVALGASYSLNLPGNAPTAGLQCIQTATGSTTNLQFGSCGAVGSFVSLQSGTPGTPDTGNLNISGVGIAGSFYSSTFDAATAATLNIGTGNASSVSIGKLSVTTAVGGALTVGSTISGGTTYTANNAVQAPSFDTASNIPLSVGTTNASAITLAKSTTIASGMSLTVLGGSGSFPTGTEGMIYYRTDTKQLYVYANGKWQADRNTATKMVADGSTTQNPEGADYVVPAAGVAAETTINAAIAALPSAGGTVYLREGTYTVGGTINLPTNVTLTGSGNATVIKLKAGFTGTTMGVIQNADQTNGNNQIAISNLIIDGNKANVTAGQYRGINLLKVGSGNGTTAVSGIKINNIIVQNFRDSGVYFDTVNNSSLSNVTSQLNNANGFQFFTTSYTSLNSSTAQGNATVGVNTNSGSVGNTVSNNIIQGNTGNGILTTASSNSYTANTIVGNGGAGFLANNGASSNAVSGNAINSNQTGLSINVGSSANSANNSFTGNTISSNTTQGIVFDGGATGTVTNNIVNGNKLFDNGGTGNTDSIKFIGNASTNSLIANDITDTAGTGFAINVSAATDVANFLSENRFSGTGATTINDSGVGTIWSNQLDGTGAIRIVPTSGTGSSNGSNVYLSGGAGAGTGAKGLVVIDTPTFTTSTNTACATSCTLTQSNVDSSAAVLVTASTTGLNVTLPNPTITTAGRIVYVTAANGSSDFTLIVNGGGTGNQIAMRQNTTATMIWSGSAWTAAGASSSTTLQAAYDNTLAAAGGAEIVLNNTTTSNGLTIRNNSSNPIIGAEFEVQSSTGANHLSVNNNAVELASNGGAETSTNFSSNWVASGSGTVTRNTTLAQVATGIASTQTVTTAAANAGVANILSSNPAVSTTYQVSFTGMLGSGTFNTVDIDYSRDGGTTLSQCTYSTSAGAVISAMVINAGAWTKVTCTFTTDGTAATSPRLIIRQTDATARTFWIDNLSVTILSATSSPPNVQIGGGLYGGAPTLFTLDSSATNPVSNGNTALLGSMYYNTTSGRIQCYEAKGWGTCGASPDNYVNLVPEFAGAVLDGTGIGTLTSDFCANQTGVLAVNSTLCGTGQALNFYKWTSPQATQQTYSIYVTYQLPAAFKQFQSDNTVQLTARTDSTTNGIVTYQMYRSEGGALTSCGTETTVTSSANTWQTVGVNGNELTSCGFSTTSANNFAIFQINVKAKSNANVYVGTLSFTTNGQ